LPILVGAKNSHTSRTDLRGSGHTDVLELVETRTFGSRVVYMRYRRV